MDGRDVESGCHIDWITSIVEQCKSAQIPIFVKQLGSNPVAEFNLREFVRDRKGGDIAEFPSTLQIREFPKDEC